MDKTDHQLVSRLRSISNLLSIIIFTAGIIMLLGWAFDIMILKTHSTVFPTIKANVSLSFIFIGISLWFLQQKRLNKRNLKIAQIFAFLPLLIGFFTLIEYALGINLGIDQILFSEPLGAVGTLYPNRMPVTSALSLVFIGISLIFINSKKENIQKLVQFLIIIVGLIALLLFIGYLYSTSIYTVYQSTLASIYAVVILGLVFFSAIFLHPDEGYMRLLTAKYLGSEFLRKILPAIVLIPLILGIIRLWGEQYGLYDTAFGTTLLMFFTIMFLMFLSFLNARSINSIDIKRKKSEEKLKETVVELERSNKELEKFAYVASHDLQEPLRMIVSYLQLFERKYKDKLDEKGSKYMYYAVDGAKRMQTLIDDLLTYSRVSTRGEEFKPVDGEEILNNALLNLEFSIKKNKAVITHDTLPTVLADGGQLVQLFQNLISNAIKFKMPDEEPRIHISTKEEKDKYIFSVKDNGIGIEPKYADRIFEVFQRLQKRSEYEGTGIGLAISKKIVERHGGKIWVESEPGKGSIFYFTMLREEK